MADNIYYQWWNDNKLKFSLLPAIVFWFVSCVFFMIGLRFENPIVVFGFDASKLIAIALSISNTVIQIIGNDQEDEKMGATLRIGWYASYVLGVGTNINGLMTIFNIPSQYLEISVAVALGVMIEVLPEKLLVMFLKSFTPRAQIHRNVYQAPVSPRPVSGKPVAKPNFFQENKEPEAKRGFHPIGSSSSSWKENKPPWQK